MRERRLHSHSSALIEPADPRVQPSHSNAKSLPKQAAAAARGPASSRSVWKSLALVTSFVLIGIAIAAHLRSDRLQYRLLAALPDAAAADPTLVDFATAQARPLYAEHCARCHGADMRGNTTLGAPNLADPVWLYGDGSVYDIERTLLYGIRSGESRAHNETEMPAFGLTGRLSSAQIRSVVQFLLQLNGRPYQALMASDGRAIYYGDANCGDCHGPDARGNSDYGAPDLTRNVWNSGSDPQSLYNAIYFGQHRIMPGWRRILTLEQIRALAVYVHAASHAPAPESFRCR
jgi:cytochrome c oxidase cbb3-type subunit 3